MLIGMTVWSMLRFASLVVFRYMKLVYLYYVSFVLHFKGTCFVMELVSTIIQYKMVTL